jgi:hypothetical protein
VLATATPSNTRRSAFAEPITADKLVAQTCVALDRLGVNISPPKVHRLVHRYIERVASTGYGFAEWIANGVALHAEHERAIAWGLRNEFGVKDPTGQTAVRNVTRERGF